MAKTEISKIFQLLRQLKHRGHACEETRSKRRKYDVNDTIRAVLHQLEDNPDAAKERDKNGRTPLYNACRNISPIRVVFALLSAWPDGVKEKDENGCTALHAACGNGASSEIVSALLRAWPD
eukprot:5415283-Ditylum_brightwellii.AAC.1